MLFETLKAHVNYSFTLFFIIKQTDALYLPNLFWLKNETLHVSGSSSAHHQEFIH